MHASERCPIGGVDAENMSSSDFFSLPAGEETVAYDCSTSPVAPAIGNHRAKRSSRRPPTRDAALLSPNASVDYHIQSEIVRRDSSLPSTSKEALVSRNTNAMTATIATATGASSDAAAPLDDGISMSNTQEQSCNVVGGNVRASFSRGATVEDGDFSQLWSDGASTALLWWRNGPCASPSPNPVHYNGVGDVCTELSTRMAQPPHALPAADLDDAVWGLLKEPSTASQSAAITTRSAITAPTPSATIAAAPTKLQDRVEDARAAVRSPRRAATAPAEFEDVSPVATPQLRQLPPLIFSPMASEISPSPGMSLARPGDPQCVSATPSVMVSRTQYDINGGTSSAGDNRFSMVLGIDSPRSPRHNVSGQPFQSHSYLRFMPMEEQSFQPDDVWACSVSDANHLGTAEVRSTHNSCSTSLCPSPVRGDPQRRTAVAGDNGGESFSYGAGGTVDALLGNRYLDGMLPMMVRYGDSVLRVRQRRDNRLDSWRRERVLSGASDAAAAREYGGGDHHRARLSCTRDEYGVLWMSEEKEDLCAAGANADAFTASAFPVEVAVAEEGGPAQQDAEDSGDDDDGAFGGCSVSSAMREVEGLMAALDVLPALSKCDDAEAPAATHGGEGDTWSADEMHPMAAVLPCPTALDATGVVCLYGEDDADEDGGGARSTSTDCVALPHLSPAARSSVRCQAPAAPLPTWRATVVPPEAPSKRKAKASPPPASSPSPQALDVAPAMRPESRPLRRRRTAAAETPRTPAAPSSTAPTSSPRSLQRVADDSVARPPALESPPQTIAEMLRARTNPTSRVAPYALLIDDDGSGAHDASLTVQGGPLAPEEVLEGRAAVAAAVDGRHAEAVRAFAGVSDADWQASENVMYSGTSRCTTSCTVPAMAQIVARGCNVCLASLHARRSRPTDFTSWGSLLPEFFAAFFSCMLEQDAAVTAYAASLSVALLKHDLSRDLLGEVVRLTPVTLLGTPLLGARLAGLCAVPVRAAEDCFRLLSAAHARLSADDHLNGSIVVTLSLKQHEVDVAAGEQRDVILSSFTAFASNAEVYSDVLQAERLPATAGLLLQLFRGPVQTAVAACTRHMRHRPAELRRACAVHRVLRNRATLPPRVGSVVRLLGHIRSELQAFWAVLTASAERATERRRVLMDSAISTAGATAAALPDQTSAAGNAASPPLKVESIVWEDAAYQRERAERAQLRYAMRALTCLGQDCKAVLSGPVCALPPLYLLSPRTTGGKAGERRGSHDATRRQVRVPSTCEDSKAPCTTLGATNASATSILPVEMGRAGGAAQDFVSEESELAAEAELRARTGAASKDGAAGRTSAHTKKGSSSKKSAGGVAGALNWSSAVPPANLFAGDAACGWQGIRPLFRLDDRLLQEAFQTATSPAECAPMQTVVFLEMRDSVHSRAASGDEGSTAIPSGGEHLLLGSRLPSGKARGGLVGFTVNDVVVGAPRALRGMPHVDVGEVCPRRGSGSPAMSLEMAMPVSKGAECISDQLTASSSSTERRRRHSSSGSGASSTVREAFRGFLDGQNISILSVTEASAESDAVTRMLRSPLWLAMRELVEAALQDADAASATTTSHRANDHTGQELYMSITQPLSIDCVKDHLSSCPSYTEGHSAAAVSANALLNTSGVGEVMAFQAAWTPAGPVVAGARYIRITSIAQFYKIVRELPAHVRAVSEARRTETLGGTHVLVSFLRRQCRVAPCAGFAAVVAKSSESGGSVVRPGAESCTSSPSVSLSSPRGLPRGASQAAEGSVFLTSATVVLSTEAMFCNTLQLNDHVAPSHPLNLLRPVYCHRVVNVVDVAESAVDLAWPVLLTQERMVRNRQCVLWRVPWSLQAYTTYLAGQRDALRWCMENLVSQAVVVKGNTPAAAAASAAPAAPSTLTTPSKGRLQVDLQQPDLPAWVRGMFYGKRVWLSDITAVLRQVERMYAVGADLLEGRFSRTGTLTDPRGPCNHPMALFEGRVLYDVTAPPTTHVRTPLDPFPPSSGKDAAKAPSSTSASPSSPSMLHLDDDAHPLMRTLRTGQSPAGKRAIAAAAHKEARAAEDAQKVALRRFMRTHGMSQVQRGRKRRVVEHAPDGVDGGRQRDNLAEAPFVLLPNPALAALSGPSRSDELARQEPGSDGNGGQTLTGYISREEANVHDPLPAMVAHPPSPLPSGHRRPSALAKPVSADLQAVGSSTHFTNRTQGLSAPAAAIATPTVQQDSTGSLATRLTPLTITSHTPHTPLAAATTAASVARRPPSRPRGDVDPRSPVLYGGPSAPLFTRGVCPSPASPKTRSEAGVLPSVALGRHTPIPRCPADQAKVSSTPTLTSADPVGVSATVAFADVSSRPRSAASAGNKTLVNVTSHVCS